MAFTDPQSIKINGTTTSLPRVSTGENASAYSSSDGLTVLKASTSRNGKRKRQQIRLDLAKVAPSTLIPAQNERQSMSCYLVFDRPEEGYTNTEALKAYEGFIELLQASEKALINKLLGGES